MAIKHVFVSAKADGADDTIVRPSDWNEDHEGDFISSINGLNDDVTISGLGIITDAVDGQVIKLSLPDWFDQSVKTGASPTFVGLTQLSGLMVALAGSAPSPDGNSVHIWAGDASQVAEASSYLIVENSGDTRIQILSGNTSAGRLSFGDSGAANAGEFGYDHNIHAFVYYGEGSNRLIWDLDTDIFAFQQATTISAIGALTLDPTGTIKLNLTDGLYEGLNISSGAGLFYMIKSDADYASALEVHLFNAPNWTRTASSDGRLDLVVFNNNAWTITYTGDFSPITSANALVTMNGPTVVSATDPIIVNQWSTLRLSIPGDGANLTFTEAVGLRIIGRGASGVLQAGILIQSITGGDSSNYAIYMQGTPIIGALGALEIITLADTITLNPNTYLAVTKPILITESAAAVGDVAGLGQFWVKDDAPNVPYFTDDVGRDYPLIGKVYPLENTYVSSTGTAGSDNTAQTVKTVVIPANSLRQVGDRIRVRTWWMGDTGAAITATCTVNGVTIAASTDVGGASLFATESWLHYVDATHANIIENGTYPATGPNSAIDAASFDWTANQDVDVDQDQVAGNHIIVYAIFLDVLPKGVE